MVQSGEHIAGYQPLGPSTRSYQRRTPWRSPNPTAAIPAKANGPPKIYSATGSRKTYIACTDPAYEPLVPTHEWVGRQKGWEYLEFASGHDAMVIRPEALAELLVDCASRIN